MYSFVYTANEILMLKQTEVGRCFFRLFKLSKIGYSENRDSNEFFLNEFRKMQEKNPGENSTSLFFFNFSNLKHLCQGPENWYNLVLCCLTDESQKNI